MGCLAFEGYGRQLGLQHCSHRTGIGLIRLLPCDGRLCRLKLLLRVLPGQATKRWL